MNRTFLVLHRQYSVLSSHCDIYESILNSIIHWYFCRSRGQCKLADFGLARLFNSEETRPYTNRVRLLNGSICECAVGRCDEHERNNMSPVFLSFCVGKKDSCL